MINEVSVTSDEPWLHAFPEPTDVFAARDSYLADHLYPLASIDLTKINPAWLGWIHLVCPYEPYDDVIGAVTTRFHNDYVGRNWMSFQLTADNKYEFLGDRRFFVLECRDEADWYPAPKNLSEERRSNGLPGLPDVQQQRQQSQLERTAKHCAVQQDDYAFMKARYRSQGYLTRRNDERPCAIINLLGGTICEQNWCTETIPAAFRLNRSDRNDCHPVMKNGDRFYLIADSGGILRHSPDGIPTFFEPNSRTVLITFDYS